MIKHKATSDLENWGKDKYVKLAKDNPVKNLLKSESNSFRTLDGALMGLHEEMKDIIKDADFIGHMRDSINYKTEKYYEERKF